MERNQAASKALLEQFDKSTITDMNDFNDGLWASINASSNKYYLLEIINNENTSLEFIVKILVKIGFSLEDSIRLMMTMHKEGRVILAMAEEGLLISLQEYLCTQAKAHDCYLATSVRVR
jgi:ATP-dependent Clp protease adapter protein ClpS